VWDAAQGRPDGVWVIPRRARGGGRRSRWSRRPRRRVAPGDRVKTDRKDAELLRRPSAAAITPALDKNARHTRRDGDSTTVRGSADPTTSMSVDQPIMRDPSRHGWRAVDAPRRPVLLVNPRSGGGRAAHASLVERARERGIDVVPKRTRTSRRWSVKPWPAERTRLASQAATAHWRRLPRRPERTDSRSCAFRRAPATTSRSTLASIDTTWLARSMRSRRRAPRQDLHPSSGRVGVGPAPLARTRTRGGAQRGITGLLRARGPDQPQGSSEARTTSAVSPAHRSDT
jgi:hypothetical protein